MAVAKKICMSFPFAYVTAGDYVMPAAAGAGQRGTALPHPSFQLVNDTMDELYVMPAAAGAVQHGNVLPPTTARPVLRLRGNARRRATTTTVQRGRVLPSTTPLPTTSSPALAQPVRAALSEAPATPMAPTPAMAQPLRELGTKAVTSSPSSTPPAPAKAKPLRASGADDRDSARRPEKRDALRPRDDDGDEPINPRTPDLTPSGPPFVRPLALGEMLPICLFWASTTSAADTPQPGKPDELRDKALFSLHAKR